MGTTTQSILDLIVKLSVIIGMIFLSSAILFYLLYLPLNKARKQRGRENCEYLMQGLIKKRLSLEEKLYLLRQRDENIEDGEKEFEKIREEESKLRSKCFRYY